MKKQKYKIENYRVLEMARTLGSIDRLNTKCTQYD